MSQLRGPRPIISLVECNKEVQLVYGLGLSSWVNGPGHVGLMANSTLVSYVVSPYAELVQGCR